MPSQGTVGYEVFSRFPAVCTWKAISLPEPRRLHRQSGSHLGTYPHGARRAQDTLVLIATCILNVSYR